VKPDAAVTAGGEAGSSREAPVLGDGERDRAALADVSLALSLFALDPAGTGLLIRGGLSPLRERMLEALAALRVATLGDGQQDATPWRRVPLGISDDRLLGGLDLAATLARGRAVTARGLLAEADGGIVMLPLVEQLPQVQVAQLCAVLDDGRLRLAREGVTETLQTRFGVLALDEGAERDERCAAGLSDRLLLHVTVPPISALTGAQEALELATAEELRAARARLPAVVLPERFAEAACAAAHALGVDSLRAARGVLHVARLLTALVGEQTVDEDAVAAAARLVLAPRATRIPAPPQDEEEEEQAPEDQAPPAEPETPPEDGERPPEEPRADDDDTPELDLGPETELMIAAAAAAVPPDVLAALAAGPVSGGARRAGRAGAEAKGVARGRPAGVRQGAPKRGERLSVVDTLRAASPWQGLRGRTGPDEPVQVRAEDFRVVRRRARLPTLTIFVVDASGSAAVQRLAEAKGAVEHLLADCYVRRDEVAVVAFRGDRAEVLLPPTRSLLRARRSIAGLPGGGGTPLAAGLIAAQQLADDALRRGATPVLVLLTDGRANVTLEGQGDRRAAREEASAVGRRIAATGQPVVVIDTSRRPGAAAAELAKALAADYRPLPLADAAAVSEAVRAVQASL
jgi:magnesium chelatase subunit D